MSLKGGAGILLSEGPFGWCSGKPISRDDVVFAISQRNQPDTESGDTSTSSKQKICCGPAAFTSAA